MRKLHFKILLLIILLILLSSIIVSSQLTFNSTKASHEGEKRGLRLEEECLAKKKKRSYSCDKTKLSNVWT